MTAQTDYLYLSQEDLYRFGNSLPSRLDHVRTQDVDLYDVNSITHIRANGKGISLLTEADAARKPGWLWRIPKNTAMVPGLALNPDRPGHFSLCPVTDMTLDKYRPVVRACATLPESEEAMNMSMVHLDLNHWEARFLLEACRALHKEWLDAANAATDEDEQADYSNDLGQLEIIRRRLEQEACATFGPNIKQFSREAAA